MSNIDSHYSFSYNYIDNNPDSSVPNHTIVHNVDGTADVTDLIETFHRFLLACGFTIPDGFYLDLVQEEGNNKRTELDHPDSEEE
jgi:hypothetical protein